MKLGPLQFAKKSCVKGAFRGDVCNRLEVLLKSYEKSINLKVKKKNGLKEEKHYNMTIFMNTKGHLQ